MAIEFTVTVAPPQLNGNTAPEKFGSNCPIAMASAARRASADADDGDAVMLKARLQVALHTLEQKGQALQKLERLVLDQQKLVETERGGASATEVRCTDAMADVRRLEADLAEERAEWDVLAALRAYLDRVLPRLKVALPRAFRGLDVAAVLGALVDAGFELRESLPCC